MKKQKKLGFILFYIFILILFAVPLLFSIADEQTEEIKQEHKKFYRSGSALDVNTVLDLDSQKGGKVLEIKIQYNMIRSDLEVDWLYNRNVIGHTALSRGLRKTISFNYNKPLPATVAVRFTGPSGQVQIRSVSATVIKVQLMEEEESKLSTQQKYDFLYQMIQIDSSVKGAKDLALAKEVKDQLLHNIISQNLIEDKAILLNIHENNAIKISASGNDIVISGQIKSNQNNEIIMSKFQQTAKNTSGVKNVKLYNFKVYSLPKITSSEMIEILGRFVAVPDVIGHPLNDAQAILEKNGFKHTEIAYSSYKEEYSGKEDKIVNQTPEAGKMVARGSEVKITVYSPEKEEETSPDISESPQLDLTISSMLDSEPVADSYSAEVKVFKTGGADISQPIFVEWKILEQDKYQIESKIIGLQVNELYIKPDGECASTRVNIPFEKISNRENLKIVFEVDYHNQIKEINETNNTSSLILPNPPNVELSIWALDISKSIVVGSDGYSTKVKVTKDGKGVISQDISISWQLVDRNDTPIYNNQFSVSPDEFEPLRGTSKTCAEAMITIPSMYDRIGCGILLTVDPENRIKEWKEGNNTYRAKFGNCEPPPQAADSSKLVDLAPEYSSDCLSSPDQHNRRKLQFKIANHGPGELRQTIKYYILLHKTRGQDVVAMRELKPWDLPIKAGEARLIDADFSIGQEDYTYSDSMEICLDSEYRIAETNKMNNIAVFPFGLGQAAEVDPNAKPDLVADLFKMEVKTSMNCTEELRQRVVDFCCAKAWGKVVNNGEAKAPREGGGIDLELSVIDKQGNEIYVDRKSSDLAVGPGSNVLLEFERMPLAIFQKACQVRLIADPDNKIQESNEDNNVFVKRMEFCGQEPPRADFKVNKIWVEKKGDEQPQYEFHAEYENIGNDGIHGGISVTWTFDDRESSSLRNPPHAEPGAKSEYIYSIPISNFPADKRAIRVKFAINDGKAYKQIEEINIDNNSIEIILELPQ
jgi:osmotically-inducible protein OsmY